MSAPPLAPACPPPQVAKHDGLRQWQLYLVDWGYNTEPERAAATACDRIEVVDIARFQQLAGVGAPTVRQAGSSRCRGPGQGRAGRRVC